MGLRIAVCVREVPDTAARIRIAADAKSVDLANIEFVINPYEEYALEEALRIKETVPGTDITILTLGPTRSHQTIIKALAMGADRAIHLRSEQFLNDPHAVAYALATELRAASFDIIMFGKKGVDDDNHQVGAVVAELLRVPCVSQVAAIHVRDGTFELHREIEGGVEVYEMTPPFVLTKEKGPNEPRYTSLRELMMAKRKPIAVKEPQLGEPKLEVIQLEYPPPRPPGRIVGKGVEAVPELVRILREEAKVI